MKLIYILLICLILMLTGGTLALGSMPPLQSTATQNPLTPQNSLTPPLRYTMTPYVTPKPRRSYTPTATPTFTPSGVLITPNKANLERFYGSLPQTLVGLRVITYDQYFDLQTDTVSFALESQSGAHFTVRIEFYQDETQAYLQFQAYMKLMPPDASSIRDLQSLVSPNSRYYLGVLRYRNVFIKLHANDTVNTDEKRATLNTQEIIDILQAVYDRLEFVKQ